MRRWGEERRNERYEGDRRGLRDSPEVVILNFGFDILRCFACFTSTVLLLCFKAKREEETQQRSIRRWVSLWWRLPRAGLQTGTWGGQEEQDHNALGSVSSYHRGWCKFMFAYLFLMPFQEEAVGFVCVLKSFYMFLDSLCNRPTGGTPTSGCQADEEENRWEGYETQLHPPLVFEHMANLLPLRPSYIMIWCWFKI